MAIKPLPPTTIHLLGSAQVLTTPTSLVKELIDNALDARATSIDIIIAPNTIDKIEVRDNGHGIPVEDLDSLGRRGHTSKLRSFEELRILGGLTLGFRGEALASAVELAEVSVTTRIEGEPTGTLVKLKAPGGIAHQSRVSHPHGTTISVTNFMSNLPVRKNKALKDATKTLARIKDLLHSYALARPSIRFGLRVNKGNKGAWSFAPRPNDGMKEAVSQVIGRDAALQCIERSMTFPKVEVGKGTELTEEEETSGTIASNSTQSTQLQEFQFKVQAFLPKPDADPSKIGSGQYVSIDQRPVSYDKGTMKKIVTIFKKYITDSFQANSLEKPKNPFLCLSLTCPTASYDANVEPAKDDVLFGNELFILESIEELFKGLYGEYNARPTTSVTPAPRSLAEKLDNFELLLNRGNNTAELNRSSPDLTKAIQSPKVTYSQFIPQPSANRDQIPPDENIVADSSKIPDVATGNKKRKWNFNMSTDYTEQVGDAQRQSRYNKISRPELSKRSDGEKEFDPNSGLNPWVIAKINAPMQEKRNMDHMKNTGNIYERQISAGTSHLPALPRCEAHIEDFTCPLVVNLAHRSISPPLHITNPLLHADEELRGASLPQPNLMTAASNEGPMLLDGDVQQNLSPVNDFVPARQLPQEPFLTPPPTQHGCSLKKAKGPNRPFVNPLKNLQTGLMQDGMRQTKLINDYQLHRTQNGALVEQQKEPNAELAWAMDFEERKEEATRRHRKELRSRRANSDQALLVETSHFSPYKNRYNAAIADLENPHRRDISEARKEHFTTSLPDGDPRAYLMRRQKSLAASNDGPGGPAKLKRMKTNMLPLEAIPESTHVYDLVQAVSSGIDEIRTNVLGLVDYDSYVTRGNETGGLGMNPEEVAPIIVRIKDMMKIWIESDVANQCEISYNFSNLVKGTSPALV